MLPYTTAAQVEKIVKEVSGGSVSAPLIVNLTMTNEEETTYYDGDKTFGEVWEAYKAGRTVLFRLFAEEYDVGVNLEEVDPIFSVAHFTGEAEGQTGNAVIITVNGYEIGQIEFGAGVANNYNDLITNRVSEAEEGGGE